ncbi:hypothetical protein ACGF8B_34380 [Streptomyces sp. NPDC047917]|uniref:hypothetical protein n=1 Tax=Streptomyces sp. NPDC047917 TaxID=3365491 RepID=UPI00371FABBB
MYDISSDYDELFAKVAAELAQLHISIPVGSREDLAELSAGPAPEDVHDRFFDTEREKPGPSPKDFGPGSRVNGSYGA